MGMFDDFSGIGAGIGGLLGATGGGSKPAGSTTTTTTSMQDIPDWLKPYVMGNLNGAQGARDQLTGANNGLMASAVPEYMKTINGDYLSPGSNPYLTGTFNTAADLVNGRINSTFEGAGRYGSGAQAGAIGTADANLANQIFGGNYQAERARQHAATLGVPSFNLQGSNAAFAPYSSFNGLIPNLQNTSGTSNNPYFTNPMGNALSGALAGGQLGGMMGGSGFGDWLGGLFGGGGADLFGSAGAGDLASLAMFA